MGRTSCISAADSLHIGVSNNDDGKEDSYSVLCISFRYDEVCDPGYGFNSNDMDWGAGHFTQMVWINSTELGVGYYDRKRPDGFVCRTVVARYKPAGNGGGRFLEMVKKGSFDKNKHCKSKGRRSGLYRGPKKDTYSGIRRTEVRHAKHKHSHK